MRSDPDDVKSSHDAPGRNPTFETEAPGTPDELVRSTLRPGLSDGVAPFDETTVAVARGLVDGVVTVAYATDGRKLGGALGYEGCDRIVEAITTALRLSAPVVALWHCGGARLGEGLASLDGVGRIFAAMVQALGVGPQLSIILGAAARGRRLRLGPDRPHRDGTRRPGVRDRAPT